LFGLDPEHDQKRIGKVAQDLAARGATPEELETRLRRYRAEWPAMEATPEALAKHWTRFADPNGRADQRAGPPQEHTVLTEVRAHFGDDVDSHPESYTDLIRRVEDGELSLRKVRCLMDEAKDGAAFRALLEGGEEAVRHG
jgi:hypothetical protein